jgi:signal transduction histidine kinase
MLGAMTWPTAHRTRGARHAAKAESRHSARPDERGRDEFVAELVHDLNNLLTPVLGYTEIVLIELPADDPARADLEALAQTADQARSLARRLLSISREARMSNQAQPTWQADPSTLRRLFSRAVRDLGTSLALVEGHLARLSGRLALGHPARADIEQIELVAGRMASLVRLLRTVGHGVMSRRQALSLNAVIVDMAPEIRCLTRGDIELVLALDPSLGQVEVDPMHIERAIVNLVLNARDAMPGGGRLTIKTASAEQPPEQPGIVASMGRGPYAVLSVSDTGYGAVLSVSDTGYGIDEQTLSHLFEPFYTTKNSGTGLGLFTVRGIVAQSGGHVRVSSQPGCGSTFKIYLPLTRREIPVHPPGGLGELVDSRASRFVLS